MASALGSPDDKRGKLLKLGGRSPQVELDSDGCSRPKLFDCFDALRWENFPGVAGI